MARRKKQTPKIHVPPKKVREKPAGIGVQQEAEKASPLHVLPKYAAAKSSLFPKGGEAFEQWCVSKGISAREQRTTKQWESLLQEFAERPIHGMRRGKSGGSHKANSSDFRG